MSVREQMERAGMIKPVDELVGDSEYHQIFEVLRRLTPGNVRNVLRYLEFQFPDAVKAARKSVAGHHASNEPAEAEAEADA